MRPAAVCNYPGPRRAAREATGGSAGGGVEGGRGRESRRAARGVCPARRGRGAHRQAPRFSPSGATEPLLSPLYRGVKGTEAQRGELTQAQNSRSKRLLVISAGARVVNSYRFCLDQWGGYSGLLLLGLSEGPRSNELGDGRGGLGNFL